MAEKKRELELSDGHKVIIPIIGKEDVTIGLRRKTRHLPEAEAKEEIFWMLIEKLLTEEEQEAVDDLTEEQFIEAAKEIFNYDPKE